MKNLKMNLGILAFVLGIGAAFATDYSNRNEVIYGKLADGTWVVAQQGYSCAPLGEICTATFDPQTEDPNDGGTPSNELSGTFAQGM